MAAGALPVHDRLMLGLLPDDSPACFLMTGVTLFPFRQHHHMLIVSGMGGMTFTALSFCDRCMHEIILAAALSGLVARKAQLARLVRLAQVG